MVARHAAITAGLTSVPAGHQPALRRRTRSGAGRGREHPGRDGPVGDRRGVNSASSSPRFKRRAGEEFVDWFPPTHPDRPDARTWTCPSQSAGTPRCGPGSAARRWMPGRCAHTATRSPRSTRALQAGDRPDRHPARSVRHRRASAPRHHPGEALVAQPLHPGDRGLRSPRATPAAATTPRPRSRSPATLGLPRWVPCCLGLGRCRPAETGLAPVEAIPKALARAGLSLADVDLFEINEAFAAMCVATIKLLDIDPDRVNVSGSGCSLGHPVAPPVPDAGDADHELRRRGGGIGWRRCAPVGAWDRQRSWRSRRPDVALPVMDVAELIAAARSGNTRAVGRLLSLVESDRRAEVLAEVGSVTVPVIGGDRPARCRQVDDDRRAGRGVSRTRTTGRGVGGGPVLAVQRGARCWAIGSGWRPTSTIPTC